MNKAELINAVAAATDFSKKDAGNALCGAAHRPGTAP